MFWGGCGRDPAVVVIVVVIDDDGDNSDGVSSRQSSGAGRRRMLCCLFHRLQPDLSPAVFIIVQSSTLSPLAAVPYCQPLPAIVLSITFAAPIDGWLLRSPPTQQHTN